MVSVSVSENFGIEKSIGIGFGKIWYRKKYRYRFRKFLVSKKVSDSVSKILVWEKSFRFGFVQIFGFATHWYRQAKPCSCSCSHFVKMTTSCKALNQRLLKAALAVCNTKLFSPLQFSHWQQEKTHLRSQPSH